MTHVIPISGAEPKSTIVCMGFAQSSRDLVPWDNNDCEFWSMNERYKWGKFQYDRISRHFQLHPYENFMRMDNRNDPDHPKWMRSVHPFPIYTQEVFPDVPCSVRYPIKEVIQSIGAPYMTSSLAFMLGLALYEQEKYGIIKRIEIYGFDMKQNTEYAHQRPNAEYLIGYLRGKGVEIYLPDICPIAKGVLYGYESINIGFAQQLEFREKNLEDQLQQAHYDFHYQRGVLEMAQVVKGGFVVDDEFIKKADTETRKKSRAIAVALGSLQENRLVQRAFGDFGENGGHVDAVSWDEEKTNGTTTE